jgi:tagatose 1,6-diphosphate aldolase
MTTTFGKTWGLRRMADAAGHFKMVAIDQRPPIVNLIAARRGIDPGAVTFADIAAIKRLLARVLAPHASAMLVDPNYGYPAAADLLLPSRGLIMTLEDHRFVETPRGRHSAAIADWTVAKIRRLGADGVKVLAWFRPDADAATLAHQQAFVEGIGRACAAEDIPFVFELLVYPFPGEASHTTGYVEDPGKHPQRVVDSVRAFADPRFGVDLFKLESPLPAAALPPCGDSAASRAAQAWFDQLGAAIATPWVMLSAGAAMAEFANVLRYAYRAGAHGFLAGRAIWWDALAAFPDLDACESALATVGVPYFEQLGALTAAHATRWIPDHRALDGFASEGAFARVRL